MRAEQKKNPADAGSFSEALASAEVAGVFPRLFAVAVVFTS